MSTNSSSKQSESSSAFATAAATATGKRRRPGERGKIDIGVDKGEDADADQSATIEKNDIPESSKSRHSSEASGTVGVGACVENAYTGWTIPSQLYEIPSITIDHECVKNSGGDDATKNEQISQKVPKSLRMSPEQFFRDYVAQRRPVVLRGVDKTPTASLFLNPMNDSSPIVGNVPINKWTNSYLREKAGEQVLQVEERSNTQDTYGQGREVEMTFGHFLDLLEKGDDRHYLTTQNVHAHPETGRPDLMAPFMKALSTDFPLVPKLLVPTLVPQNINLWMGNSSSGDSQDQQKNNRKASTSGLHHDFHDNLYFVLRGTKKFVLFAPSDASKMQTRGALQRIHPNGLINYQDMPPTTPYGADLQADAAQQAECVRRVAEQRLIKAEDAVRRGKDGAQAELEAAEEELEMAMEAILDFEIQDAEGDDGDSIDSDGDEENVDQVLKKPRLLDKTVKNPNNFSTVTPNPDSHAENIGQILRYPQISANQAFCTVSEGEVLYLPASWFHEVISIGSHQSKEKPDRGGHLALNYWFHPIDTTFFDKPYSSDFWPNDFKWRLED